MAGHSKNSWEDNVQPDALGHLLQRMSTQFTPNRDSLQYQSGFVPSMNPLWNSSHQDSINQHNTINTHSNLMNMDSPLSSPSLGTQIGLSPFRSISVSQDTYSEMEHEHSPLMRSSSDLGMKSNQFSGNQNYSDIPLDGIMDHQMESIDNALFFSENSTMPLSNSSLFHHHNNPLPMSKNSNVLGMESMHYEMLKSDPDPDMESSFSSKLSNFTASLGTWFSPLDQLRASYSSTNNEEMKHILDEGNVLNENSPMPPKSLNQRVPAKSVSSSSVPITAKSQPTNKPKLPISSKPSYSDVLTKAPSQESRPFSTVSNSSSHLKHKTFQNSPSGQRLKESSSKASGKHKGRSQSNLGNFGRSNSPNITSTADSHANNKNLLKTDSFSNVGLDEFDLPGSTSSYSCYLNNLNNNNSNANILENIDNSTNQCSLSYGDSSPAHQIKKGSKNESKNITEKLEESSDVDKLYCDKLNNYSSSTHQKQTPKRTAFINNNLASVSAGASNNTSKANNSELSVSSSNYRKSSLIGKEEPKCHSYKCDNDGDSHSNLTKNSSASTESSLTPSLSSNNGSSSRSSYFGPRANRKETANKKTTYRKKREPTSYHLEILISSWTLLLLWLGMAYKAGVWLFHLTMDVIQMSYRLILHYAFIVLGSGKIYYRDSKVALATYWTKIYNFLSRKKFGDRIGGRGYRKNPFGLENNIPLPTTGEEAMKRLLACRGKDPYSILGVTRECTDDDVKRYYKRQAFLVHPDKNKQPGAEEAFKILAHAFEIIGEPERRIQYDAKLAEEAHFEGASGEFASMIKLLREKLEEAANTIRCTNCNKRHRRSKVGRPMYAARHCRECRIKHAAREGDIWAESWYIGIRWRYYACMEGAIYDISEWAACQKENLKHLHANSHSVQYRIVSGKKNPPPKTSASECPTDPELEDFFNNLCRERFGRDFVPGTAPPTAGADARKRKGKKKK